MKPTAWGKSAWTLLHSVSFAFPLVPTADEQERVATFVKAFREVLPCPTCKSDFGLIMERKPLEYSLHSREAFARWVNEVHNEVNVKLGKPTMTFEESVEVWCTPRSKKRTQLGAQSGVVQPTTPTLPSSTEMTIPPPPTTPAVTSYVVMLLCVLAAGGVVVWIMSKKK